MNKKEFSSNVSRFSKLSWKNTEKFIENFEKRNAGKRGTPEKRDRVIELMKKNKKETENFWYYTQKESQKNREAAWRKKMALKLAEKVELYFDEHGSYSGSDYFSTSVCDYISIYEGSEKAPYFDMGGEGLALISVSRTRYYSKSYHRQYGPSGSTNSTKYLVGKNEAGTYFSHPVSKKCETVLDAVCWIWNGRKIVARQGDIAVVEGRKRKMNLPEGHILYKKLNLIYHRTHPVLNLKKYPGCYIITGKRAAEQIGNSTRD